MPFAPEVEQLIKEVEDTTGIPVHVAEEPAMRLRASVTPARRGSPAHWVRFKPGTGSLDYLVASQLVFLQRSLTPPPGDRWEIASTRTEQDLGIRAMGLEVFNDDFARNMVGQIITQTRTYPIGFRVDSWIRENLPGLIPQQDAEIRSQLAENQRALAPEIRGKFPKGIVDANTSMNAAFAFFWAVRFSEPERSTAKAPAMGSIGICILSVVAWPPHLTSHAAPHDSHALAPVGSIFSGDCSLAGPRKSGNDPSIRRGGSSNEGTGIVTDASAQPEEPPVQTREQALAVPRQPVIMQRYNFESRPRLRV